MPNIYYQPEAFEAEVIGSVEWTDESYSFDTTLILRGNDGKLYWGDDSGCSCPSPFENFYVLSDFETGTFMELSDHLQERLSGNYACVDAAAEVAEVMKRIVF
jgi:hypothetical protein